MLRVFRAIFPFVLLLLSVPLAALAVFTTTIAFSTLLCRVLIVHIELALVVVHDYCFHQHVVEPVRPSTKGATPSPSAGQQRRKSRRSSAGSVVSDQGTITPKATDSGSFSLITGAGLDRDFEGVGGWRFSGPDEEDSQWTSLNSRLELPAAGTELKGKHSRSLTSGYFTSPKVLGDAGTLESRSRIAVNLRARTPPATLGSDFTSTDHYFGSQSAFRTGSATDTANIGKAVSHGKVSPLSPSQLGTPGRGRAR